MNTSLIILYQNQKNVMNRLWHLLTACFDVRLLFSLAWEATHLATCSFEKKDHHQKWTWFLVMILLPGKRYTIGRILISRKLLQEKHPLFFVYMFLRIVSGWISNKSFSRSETKLYWLRILGHSYLGKLWQGCLKIGGDNYAKKCNHIRKKLNSRRSWQCSWHFDGTNSINQSRGLFRFRSDGCRWCSSCRDPV